MTMRIFRAGLLACAMASAAAVALSASPAMAAAAAAPAGPSVSAPVGKLLGPAKKALDAKQYQETLDLAKSAQALPDLTDGDKFVINQFIGAAAVGLKDYATADTAFEAMADSPALPDAMKQGTYHDALLLANQAKHLDKAIKYGEAYLALTPANPDHTAIGSLAQAYYSNGNYDKAESTAQKAIDLTPAGTPPDRAALQVVAFSQLKQKKQDAALLTFEKTVAYYDDKDEWGDLIDFSVAIKGIKDIEALHIFRLRLATHAAGHPDDFGAGSQIAMTAGYPVEAQAFLDAGKDSGLVPGGGPTYGTVKTRATQDRSILESFAAIAHKQATGENDVKLAETLYGYGRYAEAEAAAREALAKGGPKVDRNETNMVLGESLAMQGKNADAVTTFNAVSNPSPGWAKAQHLWLLYANRAYATAAN